MEPFTIIKSLFMVIVGFSFGLLCALFSPGQYSDPNGTMLPIFYQKSRFYYNYNSKSSTAEPKSYDGTSIMKKENGLNTKYEHIANKMHVSNIDCKALIRNDTHEIERALSVINETNQNEKSEDEIAAFYLRKLQNCLNFVND